MPNPGYQPLIDVTDTFYQGNLQAVLLGAIAKGGVCIGYEKIQNIDNTDVNSLTPATGAKSALITVEANGAQADNNIVIRFREDDGADPTITDGVAIGHMGAYEIRNEENLGNFKFISPENLVQTVHVLYYR